MMRSRLKRLYINDADLIHFWLVSLSTKQWLKATNL